MEGNYNQNNTCHITIEK